MDLKQTEYELKDGIALIRLNRPDQLNAFTPVMREELIHLFREADQDDRVRAVVVTGAGRAFCAGADLSGGGSTFDRAQREGREIRLSSHRDGGGQVSLAVFKCRKPVLAAIHGPAVVIGMTMTPP
ncbi:MAG: enoyl-CoA hydratase, partial [Desulfobacteraceae bacterium]